MFETFLIEWRWECGWVWCPSESAGNWWGLFSFCCISLLWNSLCIFSLITVFTVLFSRVNISSVVQGQNQMLMSVLVEFIASYKFHFIVLFIVLYLSTWCKCCQLPYTVCQSSKESSARQMC